MDDTPPIDRRRRPRVRPANDHDEWGPHGANFLRQWREDRQHTLESLAIELGTTKGTISQLENGKRRLNSTWLKKLATALHCEPGDILSTDPEKLPDEIRLTWLKATPAQRRQIAAMAEQLVKYG